MQRDKSKTPPASRPVVDPRGAVNKPAHVHSSTTDTSALIRGREEELERARTMAELRTERQYGDKHRILYVTGLSGVGKDALVRKAVEEDDKLRGKINIFNFGEELLNALKKQHPGLSRKSDLSRFSQDQIKETVFNVVSTIYEHVPVVLIGQMAYRQGGSIVYNFENERAINPMVYLYVTADPIAIINKTNIDAEKRLGSIEDIRLLQKLCMRVSCVISEELHTPMLLLVNEPYRLQSNVETIRSVASGLL